MRVRPWLFLGVVLVLSLNMVSLAGENKASDDKPTLKQLPKNVRKVVRREVQGGEIVEIKKLTEKGQVIYDIELRREGQEIDLEISPEGKILTREVENVEKGKEHDVDEEEDGDGDDNEHGDDEDQDGEERVRKIVKALIEFAKSKGAEVKEIERVVTYKIELIIDGQEVELVVSTDQDADDDEKVADNDDDEDEDADDDTDDENEDEDENED